MILAGDIGGTKTNLALFTESSHADGEEQEGQQISIKAQNQYASRDYASLTDVIVEFQQQNDHAAITTACFGIAGPVINGRCRTTNLPWDITTEGLQQHLGTDRVRLINDLEATAYGMLYLPESDYVELNPTGRNVQGNRAVIAAGTGLGEGMLYWDGTQYQPIGSEGGHTSFAPINNQQDELLFWLRNRFPGHVSYERILSGPGIYTLYEFLAETGYAPQPHTMLHISPDQDRSAQVSQCALQESDPLCLATLKLFAEIYGAEAGNLALKTLSLGGVYIGGGIAPKIMPLIRKHFMDGFVNKGRFEELLRGMQVKVSLNSETALLGAAYFAKDKL